MPDNRPMNQPDLVVFEWSNPSNACKHPAAQVRPQAVRKYSSTYPQWKKSSQPSFSRNKKCHDDPTGYVPNCLPVSSSPNSCYPVGSWSSPHRASEEKSGAIHKVVAFRRGKWLSIGGKWWFANGLAMGIHDFQTAMRNTWMYFISTFIGKRWKKGIEYVGTGYQWGDPLLCSARRYEETSLFFFWRHDPVFGPLDCGNIAQKEDDQKTVETAGSWKVWNSRACITLAPWACPNKPRNMSGLWRLWVKTDQPPGFQTSPKNLMLMDKKKQQNNPKKHESPHAEPQTPRKRPHVQHIRPRLHCPKWLQGHPQCIQNKSTINHDINH